MFTFYALVLLYFDNITYVYVCARIAKKKSMYHVGNRILFQIIIKLIKKVKHKYFLGFYAIYQIIYFW
jgi:hypothetical protein